MQDKEKIARIAELIVDLSTTNSAYSNESNGTHYDYDRVVDLLEQAQTIMDETARNPRPANLPESMPWSERFADPAGPEAAPDLYSYDGSMSEKDYDLREALIEADRKKATVDLDGSPTESYDALPAADLQAGNTLKMRYFDLHGVYVLQSIPFSIKELELQAAWATVWVDTHPHNEYAGWTAFQWSADGLWEPYRDGKGAERQYDTGRRV